MDFYILLSFVITFPLLYTLKTKVVKVVKLVSQACLVLGHHAVLVVQYSVHIIHQSYIHTFEHLLIPLIKVHKGEEGEKWMVYRFYAKIRKKKLQC